MGKGPMQPRNIQDLHYQAGIDWTKAARLAMGKSDGLDASSRPHDACSNNNGRDIDTFSLQPEQLVRRASIKYPATVGKGANRLAERDSFLRGGEQFKSFQNRRKAGYVLVRTNHS